MVKQSVVALTCASALLALCGSAHATTFVLMSEDELAHQSTAVVNGWVTGVESAADDMTGGVNTYVTIEPNEVVAGALPDGEIVLREHGGQVPGRTEKIFGAPEYALGEHVLVFLSQHRDGSLYTTGMAMGKYTVQARARGPQSVARTLGEGVTLLDLASGHLVEHVATESTDLADFVGRVRQVTGPALARVDAPRVQLTPPEVGVTVPHNYGAPFTYLGVPSRWFEPDSGLAVHYLIDPTGDAKVGPSGSRRAVDNALAAWTNVSGSRLALADGGLLSAPAPFSGCSGSNRIVFNDPFGEITDPDGCGGVLAIGGYCSNNDTATVNGTAFHRITLGKVVFNNGWDRCSGWNECNLAEVATHEIGHTIGLGHSQDDDAVMAALAHFDGRCASVRADDVAGVEFIYPLDGASGPAPTPTRTPTSTPQPTSTSVPPTTSGVSNDTCSSATVIDGSSYSGVTQTTLAQLDYSDPAPACGNGSRGRSVWYRFTAPSSGSLAVNTFNSTYDTILAAYTGSCGSLVPVAGGCNDDYGGRQSRLTLPANGGTTYYFLVTAYANDGGSLTFQLAFQGTTSTATPTRTSTPQPATPTNTPRTPPTPTFTVAASSPTATRPPTATPTTTQAPTPVPPSTGTNDTSADAVVIVATPFRDVMQTTTSGFDAVDPAPFCGNGSRGKAAWYRFTAPSDGSVVANTYGSSYDTILTTFVTYGSGMTAVSGACNDDSSGLQSRVAFAANAGSTYYFLITAYRNDGGTLVFQMTFQGIGSTATPTPTFTMRPPTATNTTGPPPTATFTRPSATPTATAPTQPSPTSSVDNGPNSSSANATTISTTPYGDVQSTTGATPDPSDPGPSCGNGSRAKPAWYRFTAPSDGWLTADTLGSSYDTILAIFAASSGGEISFASACNDDASGLQSRLSLQVNGGVTYYFLVTAYRNDGGTLAFHLAFQGTAQPVATPTWTSAPVQPTPTFTPDTPLSGGDGDPNDLCVSAAIVPGLPYLDRRVTTTAGMDAYEAGPTCGNRSRSRSAWYRFTAPATGTVTATTYGSSYDTILTAFSGVCGRLTALTCNDDAGNLQSRVSFPVSAGVTYYFLVSSYRSDGGTLVFQLSY